MKIKKYHAALSLKNAYETLNESKQNVLIGGGVWLKMGSKEIETMVDLKSLDLDKIIDHKEFIEIGSLSTLRDLEINPGIKRLGKGFLADALNKVMGAGFRNVATIGGSIIGKYAFSDILTPLITLDVELIFYPKRSVKLIDFLETKGRTTDILTHIIVKKNQGEGYFKKVSNTVLDFAIINVSVLLENKAYKIAIGARPGVATLAQEAMDYLNKQAVITEEVIAEVGTIIENTIHFGSNKAAQDAYRKLVAITYVKRGIKEVTNCES